MHPETALAALLLGAAGILAAPRGPIMEKGRDIRPQLEADSLRRAQAANREARNRDLRQALLNAARINEFPGDCLAYDPSRSACISTVEEFNRGLENREAPVRDEPDFPLAADIDAMQSLVLGELLRGKFLTGYSAPGAAGDSLESIYNGTRQEKLLAFRKRIGEPALQALYRAQRARFAAREEKTFQVLVSSDSALADSLKRAYPIIPVARRGRFEPSPWQTLPADALPPALLGAARDLSLGATLGPLKTAYGYAYLRLLSSRIVEATPFEAAVPALIALAQKPADRRGAIDQAVAGYYRAHADEFTSPDTARFRAWLTPLPRKTRLNPRRQIAEDTAAIAPRPVDAADLPDALQRELSAYRSLRPGDLLGPLRSLFGTWYFEVIAVKPGGRPLTLAESRPAILQALFGSSAGDPEAFSLRDFDDKEKNLRASLAEEYLRSQGPARLERERREWMQQLILQYVSLPPAEESLSAGPGAKGQEGKP